MRRCWCFTTTICMIVGLSISTFSLVRAQSIDFQIGLFSPDEGETFYSGPSSLVYFVPIRGWIKSSEYTLDEIQIELSFYQGTHLLATFPIDQKKDGVFEIYATVNSEASSKDFPLEHRTCATECHSSASVDFPSGLFMLEVTAIDPSGNKIAIQRHLSVDKSSYAIVPVKLVLEGQQGFPLANIPVQGSTRLYLWRARYANASTNNLGIASLKLETLSLSSTRYILKVEPTVVEGILYQSVAPVEVILPPSAESVPEITLQVHAMKGEIIGDIITPTSIHYDELGLRMIHLPDGDSQPVVISENGYFSIPNLLIGKYILAVDPYKVDRLGYEINDRTVDLTYSIKQTVALNAMHTVDIHSSGTIQEKGGLWLPFTWVYSEKMAAKPSDPDSGKVFLRNIPKGGTAIVVSAPGYFSQAYYIWDDTPEIVFNLTRRPETTSIPFGDGEIVIPPETVATVSDNGIILDQGWLWGHSQAFSPISIQLDSFQIDLNSRRFAVERNPINDQIWLYVFDGEARIAQDSRTIMVQAGQMIALKEDLSIKSVPYTFATFAVFHMSEIVPVNQIWEPTSSARFRDGMAQLSVNIAQGFTFLAYGLILFAILFFPLAQLYAHVKDKNTR